MRQWLQMAVVSSRSHAERGNKVYLAALSFVALWIVGCSDGPNPTPSQGPGGTAVEQKPLPPASAGSAAAEVQPATPAQPVVPATPAPPVAPATPEPPKTAVNRPSIQLATGVALPQTGPDGIMMGFSIDYEFVQGEPSPEGYVWVIERAHGNPARQQVKLSKQGNLPIMISGWRPEDGPFQSHIEDRKGTKLSESIEML